jgi:hypothetical protein
LTDTENTTMRYVMLTAMLFLAVALRAEEATPAKVAESAAAKIDLTKDAAYTSGDWTYTIAIKAKGTRSEGVFGSIVFHGEEIHPGAKTNDWMLTPWGKLYHMGEVKVPWGRHGWMPEPDKNSPEGKQLGAPK